VKLRVINGDKIVNLRFFDIFTDCCPELQERLGALLGENSLRVETKR
jgi:hypothetical protein